MRAIEHHIGTSCKSHKQGVPKRATAQRWPGHQRTVPGPCHDEPVARNHTTFATKFTDAQKEACIKAVIVDGLKARDVAAKAAAGELPGVGKFEITINYVNVLARAARGNYNPEQLADHRVARETVDLAQARILTWLLREVDRYEVQARAGKVDITRGARLTRALGDWYRAVGKPEPKPKPGREDPNPPDSNTAEQMIAALLERANGQSSDKSDSEAKPVSLADAG